jgi:DNA polymerase
MDAWADLRLQIEWGADEALDDLPIDRLVAPPPRMVAPAPAPAVPLPRPVAVAPPAPAQRAGEIAAACNTLDDLREALAKFDGCPLSATATNLVFGDGNPSSGLMLVGEGPGAEEDRAGLPFVGASGQFLDRMLASIGLDRSNVYITNLIPWRPPGNRNPTDAEIVVCLPFLLRHIALVRPKLLVLLGNLSVQSVTQSKTGITRARGKWQDVEIEGIGRVRALPMLHPAYLLRNHGAKREAWADMVTLRRALDQG